MDSFNELLSTKYLQDTKYTRDNIHELRAMVLPAKRFKSYPDSLKVKLDENFDYSTIPSLYHCLKDRRSIRRFEKKPIALKELSILLWATQGVTARMSDYLLRTAPSAGALYPIETYIVVNYSNEISPGIYHFNIMEFSLEEIKKGDFSDKIASSCLGQTFLKRCPIVFVWTSVTRRCAEKYTHRAMRYIMMDVGHICQNLCLMAVALEMGTCPVAAFFDDEVNELLGVDGIEESVVYLSAVGYPHN